MRRSKIRQNINRNSDTTINDVNINPIFVNTVDPEFVGSQNWLSYEGASGVDIIEINDSDLSETTSDETPKHNLSHPWSYANNTRTPKEPRDRYRINAKARERRRLQNSVEQNYQFGPSDYARNNSILFDSIDVSHDSKNEVRLNHQINCFTIINKHLVNSETSSETTDYDIHELNRPMGDALLENPDYYLLEDEMLTYNPDYEAEKKTIWIYSFKNKHLLSDDCFELVNIPSKDTESGASFSFEKFEKDPAITPRAASPIPPPYIPRLDLSLGQTLSTVTEITEPNKQPSSVETDRSTKEPVVKKPKNSWVVEKNKDSKEKMDKQEKSTNIVNWMALSPRERRRIFREHSDSDVVYNGKLATLQVMCSNGGKKTPNLQDEIETIETCKNTQSTVDVDVHALPESTDSFKTIYKDTIKVIPDANLIHEIEKEDLDEVKIIENIQVNMCSRKPQIKINKKSAINLKSITDPIEKLNSDNWIVDEDEKPTPTYNSDLDGIAEVTLTKRESSFTASDRLWSKNALALMKPAQWNEYEPIGESHLSLHLSLDTTFEKQTCFSRLINLFRCCK